MRAWLAKFFRGAAVSGPLGLRGEALAADYLRSRGYRILVRNYRCAAGEIDIIARQGNVLVFVEVKTRAADDPAPEEQVNPRKQRQVTRAARTYLARYGHDQPPARMDVIAVVWPDGGPPTIRHTPDAFEAAE